MIFTILNNFHNHTNRSYHSIITAVFCVFATLCTLTFVGCTSVSTSETGGGSGNTNDPLEQEEWLIPQDQIYVGAGRDQIQSIDDPTFSNISEIDFMKEDDLVLGFKMGGEIKAYPHKVLNYHEIVNDIINEIPVAITFCPLTGSGITWNRSVQGEPVTFGVSGLIYKNNLIAYDRKTQSNWSQMLVQSVNGPLIGRRPPKIYHNIVEMTWSAWKESFPNSKILNGTRLMEWAYSSYPYGEDYPENNESIIFPIENEDDRLGKKELCHGIFYNVSPLIFPVDHFPEETKVINHNYLNNDIVVAGNSKADLVVSFSRALEDGTLLKFSETNDNLPVIMEDTAGNKWNVFGEAVSGPRKGAKLTRIPSYNAYWFAWADFFDQSPKDPKIFILDGN